MNTRLKEIREKRGYLVADIAKVLGATPKQVKKWEEGKSKMKTHN